MLDRIRMAVEKRQPLLKPGLTSMARLVDAEGDGLPGIWIEAFSDHWVLQTKQDPAPGWAAELVSLGAKSVYWKLLDGGMGTNPDFVAGGTVDAPFEGLENGTRFWIDFQAGYSQGIFLDQRDNRRLIRERAKGGTVLNTFAYTCGFGLAGAVGGAASTTNIDLSKNYLEWGRRNYVLNGIDPAGHEFVSADAFDWLALLGRKGRRFSAVVLDPPTFSRTKRGKVFRVEKDYAALVTLAAKVLEPDGLLLCTTNQRSLHPLVFEKLVRQGMADAGHANVRLARTKMPPDFTGEAYLKSLTVTL